MRNARTIGELRRVAYFTKGEFPGIAHKDDPVSFADYLYNVNITQPNVSGTVQETMKLPDAELCRAAAEKEMDGLEDLRCTSWFLTRQFLLGHVYTK